MGERIEPMNRAHQNQQPAERHVVPAVVGQFVQQDRAQLSPPAGGDHWRPEEGCAGRIHPRMAGDGTDFWRSPFLDRGGGHARLGLAVLEELRERVITSRGAPATSGATRRAVCTRDDRKVGDGATGHAATPQWASPGPAVARTAGPRTGAASAKGPSKGRFRAGRFESAGTRGTWRRNQERERNQAPPQAARRGADSPGQAPVGGAMTATTATEPRSESSMRRFISSLPPSLSIRSEPGEGPGRSAFRERAKCAIMGDRAPSNTRSTNDSVSAARSPPSSVTQG